VSDQIDGRKELAKFTGSLIRRAQQRHVAVWQSVVSMEISSVQYAALVVLSHNPGASQRELGDGLDLDRSTIADIVSRMIRKGLIERGQAPDDKRRKTLSLTPEGKSQLLSLQPRVETLEQVLTTGLKGKETAELKRLLLALLDADNQA
jgi:DNA-binding MarR family transcriptional regulator